MKKLNFVLLPAHMLVRVIVGLSVGKTSLMQQYVNKQFAYAYKATIGT